MQNRVHRIRMMVYLCRHRHPEDSKLPPNPQVDNSRVHRHLEEPLQRLQGNSKVLSNQPQNPNQQTRVRSRRQRLQASSSRTQLRGLSKVRQKETTLSPKNHFRHTELDRLRFKDKEASNNSSREANSKEDSNREDSRGSKVDNSKEDSNNRSKVVNK